MPASDAPAPAVRRAAPATPPPRSCIPIAVDRSNDAAISDTISTATVAVWPAVRRGASDFGKLPSLPAPAYSGPVGRAGRSPAVVLSVVVVVVAALLTGPPTSS